MKHCYIVCGQSSWENRLYGTGFNNFSFQLISDKTGKELADEIYQQVVDNNPKKNEPNVKVVTTGIFDCGIIKEDIENVFNKNTELESCEILDSKVANTIMGFFRESANTRGYPIDTLLGKIASVAYKHWNSIEKQIDDLEKTNERNNTNIFQLKNRISDLERILSSKENTIEILHKRIEDIEGKNEQRN